MADIHIRKINDELVRQLNIRASSENTTQKQLVIEAIQLLLNSKPVRYKP